MARIAEKLGYQFVFAFHRSELTLLLPLPSRWLPPETLVLQLSWVHGNCAGHLPDQLVRLVTFYNLHVSENILYQFWISFSPGFHFYFLFDGCLICFNNLFGLKESVSPLVCSYWHLCSIFFAWTDFNHCCFTSKGLPLSPHSLVITR